MVTPLTSSIPEDLLHDADTAVYRAKTSGLDYEVFPLPGVSHPAGG